MSTNGGIKTRLQNTWIKGRHLLDVARKAITVERHRINNYPNDPNRVQNHYISNADRDHAWQGPYYVSNDPEKGSLDIRQGAELLWHLRAYENVGPPDIINILIQFRAAFIAGHGVQAKADDKDSLEYKFAEQWLKANGLNVSKGNNIFEYGEIDGHVCALHMFDKDYRYKIDDRPVVGMPVMSFLSKIRDNYTVKPHPQFRERPNALDYNRGMYSIDQFSYVRFNGVPFDLNRGWSKMLKVLTYTNSFQQAAADLRENGRLHGVPKPVIRAVPGQGEKIRAALSQNPPNLKLSTMFVHEGEEIKYLSPGTDGAKNLSLEIYETMKVISMILGIPVHIMGYTQDMRTKAVSMHMGEQSTHGVGPDRNIYLEFLNDALKKAINMVNANNTTVGGILDPDKVTLEFNLLTDAQIQQLIDVYIPLAQEGLLSTQTLHEKVPGVDPLVEGERLEEQRESDRNQDVERGLDNMDEMTANINGGFGSLGNFMPQQQQPQGMTEEQEVQ